MQEILNCIHIITYNMFLLRKTQDTGVEFGRQKTLILSRYSECCTETANKARHECKGSAMECKSM